MGAHLDPILHDLTEEQDCGWVFVSDTGDELRILVFSDTVPDHTISLVPFIGAENYQICYFWFDDPRWLFEWVMAQRLHLDVSSEDLASLYSIPAKQNLKGDLII